jgi:hypothetical protein
MPRNVRNFRLELAVDGRKQTIATGPQAPTGGFQLRIQMRYNGQATHVGYLTGAVYEDGLLCLSWEPVRTDIMGNSILATTRR